MAHSRPILGIVAALPAEAHSLGVASAPVGEVVSIADGILLVRSGIGHQRAYQAASQLVDAGARALLSWGTAAALNPQLVPGELVVPVGVLTGDGRHYEVDGRWRDRVDAAVAAHMPCHGGILAQATTVLEGADDKQLLHRLSGAMVADMESAAVAVASHDAGLPLLAMRAVSDSSRARVPPSALAAVDGNGEVSVGRCLAKLMLTPGDLPALIGLAKGFRAGCATLGRVAALAGPDYRFEPPT